MSHDPSDVGKAALAMRLPDLEGKPAIVTGASRGIGVGIARVLATQGMKLTLAARSEGDLRAVAADLREKGADCQAVPADLSTAAGAGQVLQAALARYGPPHLLVNNAALLRSKGFLELNEETYQRSFEANVRILYEISRPAAEHMAEAGGGVIVNISSVGGLRAHRGKAGYDASKGAMDALTRCMAVDLAPHGIRVNSVAPGAILRYHDRERPGLEERLREITGGIPLGRMGTPEDIGAAVAFLASDAASYVTGQILYVDGGLTAQLTPPGIYI